MILEQLRLHLIPFVTLPIYLSFSPPIPSITLTLTNGREPDPKYLYDRPNLQVLTKAETYDLAETSANIIYTNLQALTGQIGSIYIIELRALQIPTFITLDNINLYTFTQNYISEYNRVT